MFSLVPEEEEEDGTAQSLKTLIWEAKIEETEEHPEERLYFATALRLQDRIDERLLRQQISTKRKVTLSLAGTDVAESLTGFVSGTIPPFGHTIPLALYLDEKLMVEHAFRTGSGAHGYDIRIERSELSKFCSETAQVLVRPITKGSRPLRQVNETQVDRQIPKSYLGSSKEKRKTISMSWWTKPLAKRLRDVAAKEELLGECQKCLDEAGERLDELMYGGSNGNYTKTPVHNAAWRGCPEALTMMVEAGKKLNRDYINIHAIGDCNFGNTPIFYALTRSREEMVRHCLKLGANLLVVNNKGQTPCSLAQTHLSSDLADEMVREEEAQLRAGGQFVNFRLTHSDERKYDDLDPRFPIDDDNMDDALQGELYRYRTMVMNAPKVNGFPVGKSFPRGVRTTTEEIRHERAIERRRRRTKLKHLLPQLQLTMSETFAITANHQKPSPDPEIDLTALELLTIDDTLAKPAEVVVISDALGIRMLSDAIDASISNAVLTSKDPSSDEIDMMDHSWGLDTEWQPGAHNPVSTLQLSSGTKSFVVDLLLLCQQQSAGKESPEQADLTVDEELLSMALSKLFSTQLIALVGFGIAQDLHKLAFSYPHIPCFRFFQSVIDYQIVTRSLFPGRSKLFMSSLQKAVAYILRRRLSKEQQCSDWEERPLTEAQIEYAALDAAAPRHLLLETFKKVDTTRGDFFRRFPHLRQTMRMTWLGHSGDIYSIAMGNEKVYLGVRLAKQSWPSGKECPALPRVMSREELEQQEIQRKERRNKRRQRRTFKRAKPLPLRNLHADLSSLPTAGQYVGYSKDDCVHSVLGQKIVNSIAADFRLRFNRRGGIVEMSNCWLLFINLSGHAKDWKYRNQFSKEGDQVNFAVSVYHGYKDNDLPFLYQLGCLDESLDYLPDKEQRDILLFARPDSNTKFIFCGRCDCQEWERGSDGVYNLLLDLLDYESLCSSHHEESPYSSMVEIQQSRDAAVSWCASD